MCIPGWRGRAICVYSWLERRGDLCVFLVGEEGAICEYLSIMKLIVMEDRSFTQTQLLTKS